MRFILYILTALTISACNQPVDEVKLIPNPLKTYAFDVDVEELKHRMPCTWVSGKNGAWDAEPYDFICSAGHFGGVVVMINRAASNPQKIGRVRLMWKEWTPGNRYMSETKIAVTFLNHITDYFVPPPLVPTIEKAFWGRESMLFQLYDAEIAYNHKVQQNNNLHRLDIYSANMKRINKIDNKNKKVPAPWAIPQID